MTSYDIVGSIAILKEDKKAKLMKFAKKILKTRPSIKTVVVKAERFKGRLRTIKVKHLAGKKNLNTTYKENGCVFKLNVEKAYFSSRLANERLEIARKIKKKDRVLVMFSGVAPFPIIIQKIAKPAGIVAVELGRDANKFAKENLKMNKMTAKIDLIQGDVKKKVNSKLGKFDVIVMPRPNLKDSFIKQALAVSKRGSRIFYYGFSKESEVRKMIEELKNEAKSKIKVLRVKKAGDIAPYKYRYRIEMKVL